MRKSLRKSYEFLERDGHRFGFSIRSRPEDVAASLDCFLALHASRAEATEMKAHPDRFNIPPHRAFLADIMGQMAELGRLRVCELTIDGKAVAVRIAFQLGDELYLYYSGFDPAWRKYSVMTTLMAEIIKWAIENGLKVVNLSTGTDLGKLRWRPTEVLYSNAMQIAPTLRGGLANLAYIVAARGA